jgi:two-component system, OmpR family, KDP operon response regulator KdpE
LSHPVRILVVDDDAAVLTSMRRLLASLGHAVTTAGTAAEALDRFDAHDVAIIDLGLPDRPGLELVPEIRRLCATTRVAVWTGSTEARLLAEAAAAAGADAVFDKPPDVRKLVAWVGGASPGGGRRGR